MQTQGPITLSPHDEPEPDGLVLRGDPRDYADRIPGPEDATAVIEVSDSSLEYDRSHKLALYASAGIPQYVIVNVRAGCLEVHEQPTRDGTYAAASLVHGDATLALHVGQDARLDIPASRILP
jgi:Uma2 family endonuclease